MDKNLKELVRYIGAAYRYRMIAAIAALLVMTIVTVYTFTLPKIYKADTTVFIERSVIDRLVKGIAVTPNINERIRVLKYALVSRDIIYKTLEDIDSDVFTKSKAEQQLYIAGLQNKIRIRVRGQDLFIVSLEGNDPGFIQNFVNTLINKYIEENIASKRDEAYGANRFLEEQISSFKAKLEEADDKIIAFRRDQGIYFTVDEQGILDEIKAKMLAIEEYASQIESLRAKESQLKQQLSGLEPTVNSYISDQLQTGNSNRLSLMEKRLNDLRLRYTENYPEIVRLKYEIASLRNQSIQFEKNGDLDSPTDGSSRMTSVNPVYVKVQQDLLTVQGDLSELIAKRKNMEKQVKAKEIELKEIPEAKKQLNVLIQERNSYKKLYQDLLGRMSKSEVSKQMEIGNKTATFRIVDPAVFPERPISPNLVKMLLLAIAAGLGFACAVIFIFENLDTRLRRPDYIEDLGFDVLAVVPNIADPVLSSKERRNNIILMIVGGVYLAAIVSFFIFKIVNF